MIRLLSLIFLVNFSVKSIAQEFDIISTVQKDGTVYVTFKIDPNFRLERYLLQLYSSHDDFSTPLQYVNGPVNKELLASDEILVFEWEAKKELKKFDGKVKLRLKGKITYEPVHIDGKISARLKKGTTIKWQGGNNTDRVKIDLLKEGKITDELTETGNTGEYIWFVSKDYKKGGGYQLRFENLDNTGEIFQTQPFKIQSKIGLAIKLLPVVGLGIGYLVYVNLNGNGKGDEITEPPLPWERN